MQLIPATTLFAGADQIIFFPTLIIICLAVIVPILLGKFKSRLAVPVVVGEILLGIIAGLLYPELKDDQMLKILREIGFGFLFFLAGTEIEFSSLLNTRGGKDASFFTLPLPLGVLSWLLTVAIGMVLTFTLWQLDVLTANNWYFMAITLAPTSLGIVVAVLKDSGYIRKQIGQLVLVAATIADFGAVLVLAIMAPILENGGFTNDVLLIGLIFLAFGLAWVILSRVYGQVSVRSALTSLQTPTAPIKIRLAFLIFLAFLVLSQVIGAKIVLGTFMGGILLRLLLHHDDHHVLHELEAVGYSFFVPIFFIMVGVNFDSAALMDSWQAAVTLVPLLLFIAIINKVIPAFLLRRSFSWHDTIASGFLLTSRVSLMVAAAEIGVKLGVFTAAEEAAVILTATLLATLGPLVFNKMMSAPEEEAPPPIIIANAGKFGLELARQLLRHEEPVILIDNDPGNVLEAQSLGFHVIMGSVDTPNEQVDEALESAERFVTTYIETDINYHLCRYVKHNYDIPHVVSEVANPGDISRFEEMGVKVVNPAIDRIALLGLVTRNPTSYDILTRTDDDQEVHELIVRNSHIIGKSMRQIKLPDGMLIMAVRRRDQFVVPDGDTILEQGDFVTIAGGIGHVNDLFRMFSTNSPL